MWSSFLLSTALFFQLVLAASLASQTEPMFNPLRIGGALAVMRPSGSLDAQVVTSSLGVAGMAYAILRVSKLRTAAMAAAATQHNYRTQAVANADPERSYLNQELINHAKQNYLDLAIAYIRDEARPPRVRRDSVLLVEIVATGSPEAFKRDRDGYALDMRDSPWVVDVFKFMCNKFGARNIKGFTLHQDEATPHIHVVLVPITSDGRLSSRDIFSPQSLRQLQSEYAKAMAPHGMQRGVEYSTSLHEDVRRHHGAQQTSQQALAQLTAPLVYQPFELAIMKFKEQLSPQTYLEREQARMNAHLAEQVGRVNEKLAQVGKVATANTVAHDRARVLEKQLATSKANELKLVATLQTRLGELTVERKRYADLNQQLLRVGMQVIQEKTVPQSLLTTARQAREQSRQQVEQVAAGLVQQPLRSWDEFSAGLTAKGYNVRLDNAQVVGVDVPASGARFRTDELWPGGQDLVSRVEQAIERTKQQDGQARWLEMAKNPRVLQAAIIARDSEQAVRIEQHLVAAGANVWAVPVLPHQGPELKVSYAFDWQTIEHISGILDKVKRSPGTELEESRDHHGTRTRAVEAAAWERGRDKEEELER